jgi:hypothetical protein
MALAFTQSLERAGLASAVSVLADLGLGALGRVDLGLGDLGLGDLDHGAFVREVFAVGIDH